MIKKILSIVVILLAFMANQAFAHTGLENSTPKDGDVLTEPIQQITLNFTTKIEQTSTIEVTDTNGQKVSLGNLIIEGNELWATPLQPLENGDYKVNWKIIGADGHPIEGEFSFNINAPVVETPIEEEMEEPAQNKDEVIETENETKQVDQQIDLPAYIIPSIIGVLILIIIGGFLWLMRRKK